MQERWQEVLKIVRRQVRAAEFRNWFKPLQAVDWETGAVTLQVKDGEFQSWFAEKYEPVLLEALERVCDKPMTVEYRVHNRELFDFKKERETRLTAVESAALLPAYTFEEFVVGPSNHMAFAAAKAAAEKPGKAYNPLFVYGGTGLGKTHILHAIGHHALAVNPRLRVLYVSAETYFNDMMTSIRIKSMENFRVKYRDACDMLLVDDVHFWTGKPRTQEEFFHTFNALQAAGKQIAFTSDRFPQEISGIEERLKSRFEWGLIADITAPRLETRVAILHLKAQRMGLEVPDEVVSLIAKRVKDNIRELESCLKTLHLVSATTGEPVSVKMAQDKLRAYFRSQKKNVTAEQIQRAVATRFGLTESELKSRARTRNLTGPRHIAIYLCRRLTPLSFPEIGTRFGNRNHSSIILSNKKIEKELHYDATLQHTIEELEQRILR
jgi:chromosomal replication initiator protein